jgi:outer membrane protein assembly factor BamB
VQAFDAGTGRLLWTRDLVQEFQATTPTWGFSSSPLVVGQAVAVYSGTVDKGVVTLDTETGKTIWNSGRGGHGYASLHAANIVGQAVWLNTTSAGLEALDPETGKTVWFHDWNCGEIVRCIQPGIIDENNVVVGTGLGIGTRLISITKTGSDPSTVAKYTTTKFKPYYNDFVIHQGHAFGFDGPIFICIDLKTGEAKWKGGRYGNGQVLLLPDQELLLVISETGELILLEANPKERKVISQFRAITGKTWNHPTLVRGKLFVRNAEEAACFDVSE